jgi:hypothetical protein
MPSLGSFKALAKLGSTAHEIPQIRSPPMNLSSAKRKDMTAKSSLSQPQMPNKYASSHKHFFFKSKKSF